MLTLLGTTECQGRGRRGSQLLQTFSHREHSSGMHSQPLLKQARCGHAAKCSDPAHRAGHTAALQGWNQGCNHCKLELCTSMRDGWCSLLRSQIIENRYVLSCDREFRQCQSRMQGMFSVRDFLQQKHFMRKQQNSNQNYHIILQATQIIVTKMLCHSSQ